MTDRYVKTLLTLIAALLAVIAARPWLEPPVVQAQIAECGKSERTPCFVAITVKDNQDRVSVVGWPRGSFITGAGGSALLPVDPIR